MRIGIFVGILLLVVAAVGVWNSTDRQVPTSYVQNEQLPVSKPEWPGNTLDQRDRFMDERNPYLPSAMDLLKWQLGGNRFEDGKENDPWRAEVNDPAPFLASGRDGILWLGHASFYIRLGGIGILTDPIFGEPALLNRLIPVASPLEYLNDVDYVVLSHDHRDHMDEATLTAVALKFPSAVFLAGLRSEDVLNDWTTATNRVRTAGWYQQFALSDQGLKISFHPVRHWSRRSLFDTNWRLWGSYVIEYGVTKIYFGGDSGFAQHYRELGDLYPDIDYFLIGIGAYEPRWFMGPNHNQPAEAVQAFRDSGARVLVPMHYGTFDISDEPPSWPLRDLLKQAEEARILDRVRPLAINENLDIQ